MKSWGRGRGVRRLHRPIPCRSGDEAAAAYRADVFRAVEAFAVRLGIFVAATCTDRFFAVDSRSGSVSISLLNNLIAVRATWRVSYHE